MTVHRGWVFGLPTRIHVTDRPRRCAICDGPILITPTGEITNDDGTEHRCVR